jgi:hypothetical protein
VNVRSQVLVRQDGGAEALCGRLIGLGYRAEVVVSAGQLHALLAADEAAPRALLLAADLPEAPLASALAAAGPALREGRVTGIAMGPWPAEPLRERLREAGFVLALPRGFEDETLRFQINRAFLAARPPGAARRELRAPFAWRATVRADERRKEAFVYSLSRGGAYLATARPSLPGARIALELPLGGQLCALPAVVVHTHVPGNLASPRAPHGMGVRFEALRAAWDGELAALVAERSRALVL